MDRQSFPVNEVGFMPANDVSRRAFDAAVQARLDQLTARYSYTDLARLTRLHRETCRRQLKNGQVTLEFLESLSKGLGLSMHWMLTGNGPRRHGVKDVAWLDGVRADDLLTEIGRRWASVTASLEVMDARLARLERLSRLNSEYPLDSPTLLG